MLVLPALIATAIGRPSIPVADRSKYKAWLLQQASDADRQAQTAIRINPSLTKQAQARAANLRQLAAQLGQLTATASSSTKSSSWQLPTMMTFTNTRPGSGTIDNMSNTRPGSGTIDSGPGSTASYQPGGVIETSVEPSSLVVVPLPSDPTAAAAALSTADYTDGEIVDDTPFYKRPAVIAAGIALAIAALALANSARGRKALHIAA